MSDTPRTDAALMIWIRLGCCKRLTKECKKLERELDEANHRIRRLIEERDTARIQADRNWKLREEFEALLGSDDVAAGVANIKHAQKQAARYKVVRRMNHLEFAALIQRCVRQDIRFDDEVDRIGGMR